MKKKKLGEVLHERGHISEGNLTQAIADQQGKLLMLGELLLERGLVTKEQLASALEEVTHIAYMNCAVIAPDQGALRKIPEEVARRCAALAIARQGAKLVVVMAEPQNQLLLDEVKFVSGGNISPRLGFREEILEAVDRHYSQLGPAAKGGLANAEEDAGGDPASEMEFISTSTRQANREAFQEVQAEMIHKATPAVLIVSEAIKSALDKRASDIHVEPQAKEVVIRMRVDGVLRDLRREPRSVQNSLISRIKILADMDIAERRSPQDGRFMVRLGSTSLDLRISTLPTQYGEKVVMRLLNSASGVVSVTDLSMPPHVDRVFRRVLSLPQGMLLITGPTGSGKSTSLYAALNLIRKPAVNIVTVEDPVEYVLPGINQVHVNAKAGLTFASCLRSILRQDPNVIMIGEIRDKETAEIAMKAAQTGHLVLSTLHTNDSLSAVTRLLDLDIPGYMIASSVTAILAQRLVRRLCDCRRKVAVSDEAAEMMAGFGMTQTMHEFYVPGGCEECDDSGYRGRIGVYEILEFDEAVTEAVRRGGSGDEIRGILRSNGMKLMQEDALEKVQRGITSLEEVARVLPTQAAQGTKCSACGRKIMANFMFCPHCGVEQGAAHSVSAGRSAKSVRIETARRQAPSERL